MSKKLLTNKEIVQLARMLPELDNANLALSKAIQHCIEDGGLPQLIAIKNALQDFINNTKARLEIE